MKLISTDFSNLGKKTIYDFGDDEAINELFKDEESTKEHEKDCSINSDKNDS